MSYRSNSTGFTLIELLIIVVLLAIMASFAIPSFKQLTERNELQSAAEELNAMLQYARSEAVSQRRAISIQALMPNSSALSALSQAQGESTFASVRI